MFKSLIKILSTFFYVGYLPLIPGTFGSMAGIGLFYLIRANPIVLVSFTVILIVIGFFVSGKTEQITQKKDPSCVVIDEVCGMLLSLLFIPYDIKLVIAAFFLFRILDTLKPFPIGRLERLKGGLGIMCDDLVAGLYVNIILQAVLRLTSFKAS